MQKVLELCLRHATTSEQLVEEAKEINQLDQSLGDIMSMTGKLASFFSFTICSLSFIIIHD